MNPCTLGWYLPLLVQDVPGADRDEKNSSANANTNVNSNVNLNADKNKGKGRELVGSTAHGGSTSNTTVTLGSKTKASSSASSSDSRPAPSTSPAAPAPRRRATWQDLDAKFRRGLPDEAYVGRLGYRGLVMRACPAVRVLDGVEVTAKEREKAERLLRSVVGGPGAAA